MASMYARKRIEQKQTYKAAKKKKEKSSVPLIQKFFFFFFPIFRPFFFFVSCFFLVYRYLFCTSCELFFQLGKITLPLNNSLFLFNDFHYEAKLICKTKKEKSEKSKKKLLLGKWKKELCEQIFFLYSFECIAYML